MRNVGVVIVGFVVLLLLAVPVSAKGPYVGVQAGAVFLADSDIEQSGLVFESSFDTGFGVSAAGGYDFGRFRLEGEVFYKSNDFDEVTFGGATLSADGDMSAIGFMVNAYVDFRNTTRFTPFLGAGAGFAQVSINDLAVGGLANSDDDDTVFAYQGIAGVGYSITPALTLELKYKYLATSDPSFADLDGVPFDAEYASHNAMAGLRFAF